MIFNKSKDFFLDLLFPRQCFSCHQEGQELCLNCLNGIELKAPQCLICQKRSLNGKICDYCRTKTQLSRFFSVGSYDNELLRESIHLLKYSKVTDLSKILGELAANYWRTYLNDIQRKLDVLIPIPLHSRRLRQRGFNQSELIAKELNSAIGIPIETEALERLKNTLPQVKIKNKEKREINMRNAFLVKNKEAVREKTIILFDDVATTGATLDDAARALKESGARSVWALVLAK